MGYDPQYDETNASPEPSDEADVSMEFTDEYSDELLYEPLDEIPLPLDDTRPSADKTRPTSRETGTYDRNTKTYLENVPDFDESNRPTLTGRELLTYICMIGILSGVAWWVTQELKQLGATQEAQARVQINTALLPKQKTTAKAASTKSAAKNPSGEKTGPALAVATIGSILDLLIGPSTSHAHPEQDPVNPATAPGEDRRKLLNDLDQIPSDASWMDRTMVLLPAWNADPSAAPAAPEPAPGFWEDPFYYGKMRVDQNKASANNKTGIPTKVVPVTTRFVLNGIMVIDGQPTAIINGRHVREGGWIGDMKVLKIDAFSVTLEGSTGKHTLRL